MESVDHKEFLTAAVNVAGNSNCIRRSVGAVLVRAGEIITIGWNGIADKESNCRTAGCPRCIDGGETGSGYEECICIHAEQHAVADAAKRGVSTENASLYVNLRPCLQCLTILRAAGINEVFFSEDWDVPERIAPVYRALTDEFAIFRRIA